MFKLAGRWINKWARTPNRESSAYERRLKREKAHKAQWDKTPRPPANQDSRQVERRWMQQFVKKDDRTHNVSGLEIPEHSRGIRI